MLQSLTQLPKLGMRKAKSPLDPAQHSLHPSREVTGS